MVRLVRYHLNSSLIGAIIHVYVQTFFKITMPLKYKKDDPHSCLESNPYLFTLHYIKQLYRSWWDAGFLLHHAPHSIVYLMRQ